MFIKGNSLLLSSILNTPYVRKRQLCNEKFSPPNLDIIEKIDCTRGGGYLTRFWTGTCHRGCKHIPVPYTNFSKMYTRLYTNLFKIYTGLYTNFPKMHTQPYTNCENCENRYRSLYQNRENRYPSRWHVPVPKICIVPPPGRLYFQMACIRLIRILSVPEES